MAKHKRRRAGGRAANTARRAVRGIAQPPWRLPENTDAPVEPVDPGGIERIHKAAMRILSEIGVAYLNGEALDLFRKAGQRVDGEVVYCDPEWVMEMVAHAPSRFTITPRNRDRQLTVGGKQPAVWQRVVPAQLL